VSKSLHNMEVNDIAHTRRVGSNNQHDMGNLP